jgi:hypothetical protein
MQHDDSMRVLPSMQHGIVAGRRGIDTPHQLLMSDKASMLACVARMQGFANFIELKATLAGWG